MSVALAAPFASSLDRLRDDDLPYVIQAALVAAMALLTALAAQAEIQVYLWEVPLTLQTLAVYTSGLVLGRRNGALAMALYLAFGLVAPAYAGGASGLAHLVGPSGGYLLAFPLVALVAGDLTAHSRSGARTALALAAGSLVLFTCGVVWLHVVAGHATFAESVANGWLRFLPWDLAKLALVGAGYQMAGRAPRSERVTPRVRSRTRGVLVSGGRGAAGPQPPKPKRLMNFIAKAGLPLILTLPVIIAVIGLSCPFSTASQSAAAAVTLRPGSAGGAGAGSSTRSAPSLTWSTTCRPSAPVRFMWTVSSTPSALSARKREG
jgi:biotin transport system substrate-specific component